jgi:hypothetical protein
MSDWYRDFFGDADGAGHGVGDRLLAEHIDAVLDGEIDDLLVEVGRHHDCTEIGLDGGKGAARVGEAGGFGQVEHAAGVGERRGVDVDDGDYLDGAVVDVGAQELAAPAFAETADADMDYFLRHHTRPGSGRAGPWVWFHRWPVRLRPSSVVSKNTAFTSVSISGKS